VLAALGALLPSSYLQEELIPELPNIVEMEFEALFNDRLGYFVIGLSGPLVEELVFRGAILRALLRWRSNPWIGIVISAVFFSLSHMNPAQMPHAFLIGILLGWMYYRTDSIVPGVVYHWVNNTVAYVFSVFYQNPDMELIELFEGNQRSELLAVLFSLCILIPSIVQLNLRMKK
jgi:membrane protease YdiL (CAAX protease family)